MKNSKGSLLILLCIYLCSEIIVIHANKGRNVYIAYLGDRPHDDHHRIVESHHDLLASVVGRKEEAAKLMVHNYKYGFSGFSAKLTESQAKQLAAKPGVIHLLRDHGFKPHGTRAPDYLGLSTQLPDNILQRTKKGEGIIIGIVDSGIWANNSKAFSDEGYGPIPARWKGKCESFGDFNASQHCNRKVIGAYWHRKGATAKGFDPKDVVEGETASPLDLNGHGTHCASNAAGSEVSNVTHKGHHFGTFRGVAPRAHLAIYKACFNIKPNAVDECLFSDVVEAFDQAIHDGVDVISASIGVHYTNGNTDINNNPNFASYHAAANGIVVVASAGNMGPGPKTVGSTSPWHITVAATTMDDGIAVPITLGNNITLMGVPTTGMEEIGLKKLVSFDNSIFVKGKTFPSDNKFLVEKLKGNVGFFPEFSKLSGGDKGTIDNLYYSVKKVGGVGIIVDVIPSNQITYDYGGKEIGPILVSQEVSSQIFAYARLCNNGCTVNLAKPHYVSAKPSIRSSAADFSSRGPSHNTPIIIKPDIATPGVNILAAASVKHQLGEHVDNGWVVLTGTSMATPLFAGLVALLKSQHPHWSPAAIKSAFVTTGVNTDPHGAPILDPLAKSGMAGPLDIGGGIANVKSASDPGLVYDMQPSDYLNYLCGVNYSIDDIRRITRDQNAVCPPKKQSLMNVNLASIGISGLQSSLTIQRTVTNVGPAHSLYTPQINSPIGTKIFVSPNALKFDQHVHQITFHINIEKIGNVEANAAGSLTWTDGVHNVRSPIVVLS
ncbi:serine protease [Lithospermum erythrorhizon]|uniref:Serine protease n=1 Tax=Lithospermum erythrorhizon TaxID=34254 RepID=A0AAV3PGA9_LITER